MLLLSQFGGRAPRHGPAILALCVVACGHIGLDLNDPDVIGDGDGDTGAGGASGGTPNTSSGGAASGGAYYASGGSFGGEQGDGGGEQGGEGGELNMGGADPSGGKDGSGGKNGSGGNDGESPMCDPDCECSVDDESDDICSIECLQSPCLTSCAISCELSSMEHDEAELQIHCREGAVCETSGPVDGGALHVTCTGGGTCQVNCGSAETCSTTCAGSGKCEVNCDNADECTLDCTGEGDCRVVGGLLDDILCPLDLSSECDDGSVVCGLLCSLLPLN